MIDHRALVLIFYFSLCSPATFQDTAFFRYYQVRERLIEVLERKPYSVQTRWNLRFINKSALELYYIERNLKIELKRIFAIIEIKSKFKYWVRSKPNENGSYDYGLTQQNSRYYQRRCLSAYRRPCKVHELYLPHVSLRLMRETLIDCSRDWGTEMLFVCYNSPKAASKEIKTDYWRLFKAAHGRM